MTQLPKFKFSMIDPTTSNLAPHRATPHSTGWDVFACFPDKKALTIRAGEYVKIPLGFRMLPPPGWWVELRPRSSSFAKKSLHALYGVIDNDFENELLFAAQYLPDIRSLSIDLNIQHGDAIGQIIPVQLQEMEVEVVSAEELDELYKTRGGTRGLGGFGSTRK